MALARWLKSFVHCRPLLPHEVHNRVLDRRRRVERHSASSAEERRCHLWLFTNVDATQIEALNVSKRSNWRSMNLSAQVGSLAVFVLSATAADFSAANRRFLDKNCFECHDSET